MTATVDGFWVCVLNMAGSDIATGCGDGTGVPVFNDVGMSVCLMRNSVTSGSSVVEGELSFGEGKGVSFGEGGRSSSCSGGSLWRLLLALSFPKTLS